MNFQKKETDQGLVKRAKAGDFQAFDLLVLKYQSRLVSTAYKFVRDLQISEDIVQESFIKSFKSLDSFREDSSFYTWIYRITVNTSKNFLLSKKRKDELLESDLSEGQNYFLEPLDPDNPEDLLSADQLQNIIKESIDNLSEEIKTVLILRELENLSYEQIAKVVKCPVGTVRSRIFRAREVIDIAIQEFKNTDKYSKTEEINER